MASALQVKLTKIAAISLMAVVILIAGPFSTGKKLEPVNELPILRPNEFEMALRTPAPVWDTNRVWTGATANLTREVAIGRYFKGMADDTLRVVSVQSGGTRYLVIATDTTSTAFGKAKFRIETPYSFTAGSTPHAVAVGNVDGDEYTDILAAHSATPFRLIWFEWHGAAWAARDSFAVNASINDIIIGDADNNTIANEIFINIGQTAPSAAIMRAVRTGATWDTTRILLSGGVAARGVAIGDIRPDLAGNEVYAVGGTRMWMVYYNGVSWDTTLITSLVTAAFDVVVGDINPVLAGNEIGVVHGSTSYQVSIWNWTGAAWAGVAWVFTATWGGSDNDIALGNVLADNPGNELVLVGGASTAAIPGVFWYAPNGSAWISRPPKAVSAQSDFGVAIGDINRFRTLTQEFILSGGGSLVEVEQRDFVNDVGTWWLRMHNPTAIINRPDSVRVTIFNAGSNPQSGFNIGYRFKTSPLTGSVTYTGVLAPGALDSVKIPVTMNFLGLDTLYVFTNLVGDAYIPNDTTKLHLEVYDESTVVASGFNATLFPPSNSTTGPTTWARTILSGTYNWVRVISGTNPACTPLEGYAMAAYPSYSASAGQQARLRTHIFNIGPIPRKVMLRFYMYHDPGYATNGDSVIVEYSFDDITYTRVTGFDRYSAVAAWQVHDVEIGDFPANTNLYLGFRARSGYGNNMFIDSVRVFVTTPTAAVVDAGIQAISPLTKPVIANIPRPITVTVRNYGLQTLTATPVFYTTGGADTTWENWSGSLEIGQTAQYTFSQQFTPVEVGEETLWAGTRLPGDQTPPNDVTSYSFLVCPEYHTPSYTKDFDEPWLNSTEPPFCGWRIVDGGTQSPPAIDNNDWHRFVVTSPARTVARILWSPIEWSDDWLISPRFNCSAIGIYTLNYWHYYNDYATARLDSGRVLLSTDNGVNWQRIHFYSNADDSGYKSVNITPLVIGMNNVRVAFHYVANDEFFWYIDDFNLNYQPDNNAPQIIFVVQPQNTYRPGPYIVRARITDEVGIARDSLYYIVNDVVYAVSHTTVAGDTFTFEIPTQAPGTVIEYYLSATDLAANSALTSRYRFWVLSPLGPTNLSVIGQADSTVRLHWLPPAEEISYNAEPFYYWGEWAPGDMIATQFTPQYSPYRLRAAALMFYNVLDTVEFRVWADDGSGNPGPSLYVDTIIISNLSPDYEIIDLSGANIVIDSGDFHVGLVWLGNDTPYPISDNGAVTSRSKYNIGAGWTPAGYDWVMSAFVSYLPGAKKVLAKNSDKDHKLDAEALTDSRRKRSPIEVRPFVKPQLLNTILGIANFGVERSETPGGPYSSIGTTTTSFFVDATVANETRYYYVVKANYTSPDTTSYYSNEVTIGVDFNAPLYTNTTYDSMAAGPWVVSTEITDWIGIAYDSLGYRTNGGSFTYVPRDSSIGNTYFYTIPDYPAGTLIEFYLFSQDTSWWQNMGRDPVSGYYTFTSKTGIAENTAARLIPDRVFLSQNQPNPFTSTTLINYGVPVQMEITLTVYNALGQKVRTLVNETIEPGYYSVVWDGRDDNKRSLGKGVYFLRLSTPTLIDTKKIVRTK